MLVMKDRDSEFMLIEKYSTNQMELIGELKLKKEPMNN
jgi:hypothetical protein